MSEPVVPSDASLETTLRALLDRLEAASAALPDAPTLDDVSRFLETRREPAAQLSQLTASPLGPGARRALAARVRRILERDEALVLDLVAQRADVAAELRCVAEARRTATAQRPPSARPARRVA